MDARAAAETKDAAEPGRARGREQRPQTSPQALSLLSLQRSAGNAAVVQLLGQDVQRKEAGAEETTAPPQAPPQAGGAAAPPVPAGETYPTDWFVDFDQMKKGGG